MLVRCAAPARLAEALARTGLTEIDSLPDGRLAVAGADPVRVGDTALAAGVAVYGMELERVDLEQLFFRLTAEQHRDGAPAPAADPAAGRRPDAAVGAPVIARLGLLRAELRKTFSTRLWWALGIPVLVLSVLYNLFGALFAGVDDAGGGWAPWSRSSRWPTPWS